MWCLDCEPHLQFLIPETCLLKLNVVSSGRCGVLFPWGNVYTRCYGCSLRTVDQYTEVGLLYLKVGRLIAEWKGKGMSYRSQCGWDLGSFLLPRRRHGQWKSRGEGGSWCCLSLQSIWRKECLLKSRWSGLEVEEEGKVWSTDSFKDSWTMLKARLCLKTKAQVAKPKQSAWFCDIFPRHLK